MPSPEGRCRAPAAQARIRFRRTLSRALTRVTSPAGPDPHGRQLAGQTCTTRALDEDWHKALCLHPAIDNHVVPNAAYAAGFNRATYSTSLSPGAAAGRSARSWLCEEGSNKERSPSRLTGSIFMAICAGKYCNNCAGREEPQRFRLPQATAVVDPRQSYEMAVSSQRQVRKCPAGDICGDHAMA